MMTKHPSSTEASVSAEEFGNHADIEINYFVNFQIKKYFIYIFSKSKRQFGVK